MLQNLQRAVQKLQTVPWEMLGPATVPQGMNTASSRPFLLSDHRKDARKLTRPREVTTSCWPLTHCYSSRGETGLSTCFYSHSHLQNTKRCFFKNYPCLGFVLITLQKRVIGAISWEIAESKPLERFARVLYFAVREDEFQERWICF